MKKLKWNRKISILVLIMFITVTFASFNTNLFIDGKAYVRVDRDIRITDIHLLETEYNGYENTNSEYTNHSISTDVSLPRQASSVTYEITITNVSDRRYKITDIIEDSYDNHDVKYELIDASIGNIVEPHTEKTFRVKFTNNVTVVEEDDVYETKTYTFDYTGSIQEFVVPYDGDYTIEAWGAQGGNIGTYNSISYIGGYGGYSKGTIHLQKNKMLFINVGGMGKGVSGAKLKQSGGFNGGGISFQENSDIHAGSGGGATSISYYKSELKDQSNQLNNLIIVAGGGGGSYRDSHNAGDGGHAGGYVGSSSINYTTDRTKVTLATGGTQSAGGNYGLCYTSTYAGISSISNGSFGQGGNYSGNGSSDVRIGGGGGGYYGGGAGYQSPGAGGSGYIGNTNLSNKEMYCYQCQESSDASTKTITTDNHSSTPTSEYAKEGNGYVKLTLTRKIEDGSEYNFGYTGGQQTLTIPYSGIYRLETWGAQGGSNTSQGIMNRVGGYGGYSTGKVKLNKNQILYINVGGKGSTKDGGYNGGGYGDLSGGGATHIALQSGVLSTLENNKDKILIVSGGGGGNDTGADIIPSGGGFKGKTINVSGNISIGGSQEPDNSTQFSGSFGLGGTAAYSEKSNYLDYGGGGGGGYYGGAGSSVGSGSGAGGSGYIGNSSLYDKAMYCYECEESQDINTKTISTNSHSTTPTKNTAKEKFGYSKITLLKRTINQTKLTLDFSFEEYFNGNEYTFGYTGEPQLFTVPKTGYYQIELWGASGDNHKNEYVESHQAYAGYTSGKIKLNKGEQLYVYVGGKLKRFNSTTATIGMISGGATDIRLKSTANWYDLDSLSSRIMVAGGAGQTYGDPSAIYAGGAGGLNSYTVSGAHSVTAATQTQGSSGSRYQSTGQWNYKGGDGVFGIGGTPVNQITEEGVINGYGYSSGAGGYYGGGGAPSGGSGSSYISGHNGCVAITAESDTTPRNDSNGNQCADGTTDITCSKHYSNYVFTDTRMIDGKGYEWTTQVGTEVVGMPTHDGTSTMTGNDGDGFAKITCLEEVTDYNFDFTGTSQEFVAPYNGIYKVELWGASGGVYGNNVGGQGAYTTGLINLKKDNKLYLYVGEGGTSSNSTNLGLTFNGGGKSRKHNISNRYFANGGGATDIRLENGEWNDFSSLKSRIMVAAGGGGNYYYNDIFVAGGAGGKLEGLPGITPYNGWGTAGSGGTQTSGGYALCDETTNCSWIDTYNNSITYGKFGIGGGPSSDASNGGGGGYYGGGSSVHVQSGGGGSSFISGYEGCDAIAENSTTDNIIHTGSNTHYSNKVFINSQMVAGNEEMPSHDGRTTMIGNLGNGYARITLIEKIDTYKISYDLDGGTIKNSRKSYSAFDNDISLGTPTKEGYDFVGWTGGKNLFNKDAVTTGIELQQAGNTTNKSGWYTSEYIPVKPNTKYVISGSKTQGKLNCFYDENKEFVETITAITGVIESPANAKYLRINGVVSEINTIQIEENSYKTDFEPYISTPTTNVTISKGSKGNRVYTAVWTPKYDIEYNLDGGTIENAPKSYNINSDNITLPTPTKKDYKFLGWTGGKNLIDISNFENDTKNGVTREFDKEQGTVTINGTATAWANVLLYQLTGDNKYYTISGSPENSINGAYISVHRDDEPGTVADVVKSINGSTATFYAEEGVIYDVYACVNKNYTYDNVVYRPQLEEGNEYTGFELYKSTPTKNITIPSGSKGHRVYNANWKKLIYLDVNTYVNGEHTDASVYTGEFRNQAKFDVYINGSLVREQVTDYCVQYEAGTTYEIRNITYDTDKWEMHAYNTSGTLEGNARTIEVAIRLTTKSQ